MRFMIVALLVALVAAVAYAECDKNMCDSLCTNFCKSFGVECLKNKCVGENCRFECTERSKDFIGGFKNVTATIYGKTYNFKH